MALYVSAGRRRRRLLLAAAGALAAGLLLGALAGRLTAPTAAAGAADAKQAAARASGLLDALPTHYEQMVAGGLDPTSFQASLDDGLRRAAEQLDVALAAAPWLDAPVADGLRRQVADLRAAADRRATPGEFRAAVERAVAELDARFGRAGASG
jgi:hypothetical protein